MLRKKPHIDSHKSTAEKELESVVESLKTRGMSDAQIKRNSKVRHYQAKVRQAKHQLAVIAESEALEAQKAETKARKLTLPEKVKPMHKRAPGEPGKKKAKKEKKMTAAETPEPVE